MPDTFFTASPAWGWYIVLYFFIGGIAGGTFFIASLLYLFGRPEDRPVLRLGYYVACAGGIVSGILLTLDLARPLRFWHMLLQPHSMAVMFKSWSPMSVGAWGLLLFSLFAVIGTAGALAEEERLPWPALRSLIRGIPGTAVALLGSLFGLFLAGYTGVLLSVTNRPIWADSTWLGALFLASAASTGAAALILLSVRRGEPSSCLRWLSRFDRGALVFELVVLAVFVISLGPVARVLVGWWGVLLLVGVVGIGIVWPLMLESHEAGPGFRNMISAARLVLAGGLLLRMVVVFSSEGIHVAGAGVHLP